MSALSDWPAYHTTEATRQEFRPEGTLERRPLLDKPSDSHPILELLMNEALTRIMLVSDGAVMALRERIRSSGVGSSLQPASELATLLDQLAERFAKCKTHRARLYVIREAQTVADRLRYAPDRSMVRGTPEWKEAIAKDARSCRVLANLHGVHYATISRIKKQARGK